MPVRVMLGILLCAAPAGCAHRQLARSTVQATGTVMDIQYQIVLNNLARLSAHPEAIPSHIDLLDGVVQVSDEASFGTGGGFTTAGTPFGLDQSGPAGSRQVSEQWGTDAVTDPQRLTGLQELYRTALGLPLLPPPNTVAYLRRIEVERSVGDSNQGDSSPPTKAGSSEEYRSVPIELLLSDVPPPGWFHVGSKKDVPKNACYVGRYKDCYVWVTPDGMPGLSRFTVTVLAAVRLEPAQGTQRLRGLAFVR